MDKKIFKMTIDGVDHIGSISDGFHTFDELYDHRITLFIALCRLMKDDLCRIPNVNGYGPRVWRSKTHSDGNPAYDGWFIMGIGKEKGEQITYHVQLSRWDETNFAETLERAPEWDGHTSEDVLKRLKTL